MSNPYWNGTQKAQLDRAHIRASWGAAGVAHSGTSIALANRAFDIYYRAHQNIQACPDARQKSAMQRELQDAARTGWSVLGRHPDDLEEAFNHLAANAGIWTDDETANYYGGRNKVFQGALVRGPVSVVSFLNAVDGKMNTLRQAVQNFDTQRRNLQRAEQGDDWTRVGTVLGEIKTWGERAQPFLWLAPAVQQRMGTTVSFAGALSNIHSGMTTYARARAQNFPQGAAIAIGAMRTAIGWVPVLGDFYGRAIDMIPGLAAWFRGLISDYTRRIDAASSAR